MKGGYTFLYTLLCSALSWQRSFLLFTNIATPANLARKFISFGMQDRFVCKHSNWITSMLHIWAKGQDLIYSCLQIAVLISYTICSIQSLILHLVIMQSGSYLSLVCKLSNCFHSAQHWDETKILEINQNFWEKPMPRLF